MAGHRRRRAGAAGGVQQLMTGIAPFFGGLLPALAEAAGNARIVTMGAGIPTLRYARRVAEATRSAPLIVPEGKGANASVQFPSWSAARVSDGRIRCSPDFALPPSGTERLLPNCSPSRTGDGRAIRPRDAASADGSLGSLGGRNTHPLSERATARPESPECGSAIIATLSRSFLRISLESRSSPRAFLSSSVGSFTARPRTAIWC